MYHQIMRRMAAALEPRGPDDEDVWMDGEAGMALAFRRLAVIDLSVSGRQPMHSADGRFVLAFNGEVYNHEELRADLQRGRCAPWRGTSDTEVLLEALARWGVPATLSRLDGMFAFALFDRKTRRLTLARDRFGEKPLVYGWQKGVFLFGSDLFALRRHPNFENRLDPCAVDAFFRRAFVPAPLTIHEGIAKLAPGAWAELDGTATPGTPPVTHIFWDAVREADAAAAGRFGEEPEAAMEKLSALMKRSVRRRLKADVPVGIFLSGGIDSSIIAAYAAADAGAHVRTFTIGFPGSSSDEAPYARAVANHLGTDHTEISVTERETLDILDRIPEAYDEPFADPSALPTMVLCAATRKQVTVALSGDGGDELFGGYGRYASAARDWARTTRFSPALCHSLRYMEESIPWHAFDGLASLSGKPRHPTRKLRRFLARLSARNPRDAYLPYVSRWRWQVPVRGELGWEAAVWPTTAHLCSAETFMAADAREYLPDNLEVKIDRASMAVGLEVRAPFLDYEIARFAWSLPLEFRINPREGAKWLPRRLLSRFLPPELVDRPKVGFYQPLPQWLRGDLREWADELLSENALARQELLDARVIRSRWEEHLKGRNWALDLWTALMFQLWTRAHGLS